MKTTLELYGAQTGNCIRAAIAVEEAGVSYTPKLVNLARGGHQGVEYLALNPAGKVPVLVEMEEGRGPFVLTQSNAIIFYAAGKAAGRLLPDNDRGRAIVFERFFFFVTDVIAVSHAAFSLRTSKAREGQKILEDRVLSALETTERYLAHDAFMAGKTFSAADIAAFTIILSAKSDLPWSKLPRLEQWFDRIAGRPSVQRGLQAFNQV
jgi:GST-like protein